MALPPLKVIIDADTKGLDRGLSKTQASIATFAKAGAAGLVAVGTAMAALTKRSLDQIDTLAKQARSLGLTTAAFQRMTLVAGEAGVEAGNLSSMLGLMQRNISELEKGTKAQSDAFGKLGISITDLQGLSPDEQFARIAEALDGVDNATQKTAIAMDIFGRSGRAAINMISDYSQKSQEAALFQERFGIAVTQGVSDNVERANDAVGRLGQVFVGLGNTMAGAVAPGIERVATSLVGFVGQVAGFRVELEQFFGTLEAARASLGEDLFARLLGDPTAIREHADAIDDVAAQVEVLNVAANTGGSLIREYADRLGSIGEIGAEDVMRQIADAADNAAERFREGSITADEFRTELQGIIDRAIGVTEAFASIDDSSFSVAAAGISNLATLVADLAGKAQVARMEMGALLQDTGTGLSPDDPNLLPPNPNAPTESLRPQLPSVNSDFGASAGLGGGGGARPQSAIEARLQALMQGLMTEREIIEAWRVESLELLMSAREQELLTEQDFMEQRERLEQEHQERLQGIREIGSESALQTIVGTGAQILNSMGQTNKKALKVAKVFGIAQALISTYQGAAEALKLPYPTNLFAAAKVLATGFGFVNSIKSVNENSGASGKGAAGGAGAAQSSIVDTQRVDINIIGGTDRDRTVAQEVISALNRAQRDGFRLDPRLIGAT
ncbi:MAG: hypothetical protein COZ09_10165 [Comamonadaceae bacterium CG_4_10_14_3_um_filter_60_42]|nr:MAG: hypothetical protein COZ09_10165 [Comamonadaceae bacterium CG_4_10_14_3_um_filter_60_42]